MVLGENRRVLKGQKNIDNGISRKEVNRAIAILERRQEERMV